jgi:hypothetical protein
MYENVNPAVIKSILSKMTQDELLREIEFINCQIIKLDFGSKKAMYIRLLQFIEHHIPFAKKTRKSLINLFR